jgi:mannose/fructose/N-acetylgalactosamine-specific phosphotransferase system component IIC
MENIYLGLFGSLLVLDTTVAFQFLISQPLIACTLIGWFLGDVQLGLQVGMYLQLLWLSTLPVGAAIVPEGNIAAIVISALVCRYNENYTNFNTILICSILFGVGIAYIGGELVVFYRKTNQLFLKKVLEYAKQGKLRYFTIINMIALFFHYVLMFVLIVVAMYLGDFLFKHVLIIPAEYDKYFKYGTMAIIGIGVGLVLSIFKEKKYRSFLITGLIAGCIIFYLR